MREQLPDELWLRRKYHEGKTRALMMEASQELRAMSERIAELEGASPLIGNTTSALILAKQQDEDMGDTIKRVLGIKIVPWQRATLRKSGLL